MAKQITNGRNDCKDNTGPYEYNAAQPNGQPWPNIQAAHGATVYRRLGDRRYVAALGLLRYDLYEYTGLTPEENADISKLIKVGSAALSNDAVFTDPNYGPVFMLTNGDQIRMTLTNDRDIVLTKIN